MKVYTMPVGTMGTNCYIVADGEASVVIDPGFQAEKLEASLREKGLRPEYILLTHGTTTTSARCGRCGRRSAASWRSGGGISRCSPTAARASRSCAA